MSQAPDMPIHFANSLFVNAAFPLPSNKASALLPDNAQINLVEVFPRRAVLVVSCALYRESPCGTYAEAVVALMASHEKTIPVMTLAKLTQESRYPAYVLHMLVNSAEAQRIGDELWGLPRVLAEVTIEEQPRRVICEAALDGQSVMRFVADRPQTDRTRSMQVETYTQREGTLLHAAMHCQAGAYGRTQGGGASITWGEHPIAQRLAASNVSSMPLMMRFYDQMDAELYAPLPVGA